MIDQIDQGLPLRTEHIETALIGLGSVVSYVRLLKRTRSNILERSHARATLFCGLMFASGVVAGIARSFVEGWDRSYVGMIVPALMAWFCFNVLFRTAFRTAVPPESSRSA